MCVCIGEREQERERGKGEEIQKGGTEWRGRERHIVRRFRNKRQFLPVKQHRQTNTTHFLPAASIHSGSACVFSSSRVGSAGDRERELPTSRGQAGRQAEGKPVDVFKSLLI